MASICFYFQAHQPFRLRPYSFFTMGSHEEYFDQAFNREILERVSDRCYLPTNKVLLRLIEKYPKQFKVSFSLTGTLLDQLEAWRPDVIESFQALAKTGQVEFLAETYYHSLAYLFSKREFVIQVRQLERRIFELFGQKPKVFRNTELIYHNELAPFISGLGFQGMLCEGVNSLLLGRSPNYVYSAVDTPNFSLLLKNHTLSDDLAFRFADPHWSEFPLTPSKYTSWMDQAGAERDVINLFMDYETFGEHHDETETGIRKFFQAFVDQVIHHPNLDFTIPSETINRYRAKSVYDAPDFTSWADQERDLSAWLGNPLQIETARRIYAIEDDLKDTNPALLDRWRRLQSSDHFYYMSRKEGSDGEVHAYFSHYSSPQAAFSNYSNVLNDIELWAKEQRVDRDQESGYQKKRV